jgi:hypothetical protein
MTRKSPQPAPVDPAEKYVALSAMRHRSGLVKYRVTRYTTSPRQIVTELIGEEDEAPASYLEMLQWLLAVGALWMTAVTDGDKVPPVDVQGQLELQF